MKRPRLSRWRAHAGFGLPEVLVATSVGLMAVAGFVAFNHFQLHAIENQVTQLNVQTYERSVLDLFTREVRRASGDPTCAKNVTGVVAASSSSLEVQSDLNGNGTIDSNNNEDVTYRYNSSTGTFQRTANGSSESLLSGVGLSTAFHYYDSSGTELTGDPWLTQAQRNGVRRVRLDRSVTGTGVGGSGALSLKASSSTNVDLRNRFFVASTACP
jgi:Tfp pilus assembly protein PilW